jgi:hypothetical protein
MPLRQDWKIIVCIIKSIDIDSREVILAPYDNDEALITKGVVLTSPYTQCYAIRPKRRGNTEFIHSFNDDPILSLPSGYFAYPSINEKVLVALDTSNLGQSSSSVFITDGKIPLRVVIIGRVTAPAKFRPRLNVSDNLMLDVSGAKLHFNHTWGDIERKEDTITDDEETTQIPIPSGHTTIVGNRVVELFGEKFLGFGKLSHLYDSINLADVEVVPGSWLQEEGQEEPPASIFWADVFTKEFKPVLAGTVTPYVYTPKSPVGLAGNKWLEPPSPRPSEYMRMHHSGYKVLVEANQRDDAGVYSGDRDGQERKYVRNEINIIGEFAFPLSFDPENETAHALTRPDDQLSGGQLNMWFAGLKETADFMSFMELTGGAAGGLLSAGFKGISLSVPEASEIVAPTDVTLPITRPAWEETVETGKVKLRVGNTLIEIDSTLDAERISLRAGKMSMEIEGESGEEVLTISYDGTPFMTFDPSGTQVIDITTGDLNILGNLHVTGNLEVDTDATISKNLTAGDGTAATSVLLKSPSTIGVAGGANAMIGNTDMKPV